jgi:hypothetical protein
MQFVFTDEETKQGDEMSSNTDGYEVRYCRSETKLDILYIIKNITTIVPQHIFKLLKFYFIIFIIIL